MSKNKIFNDEDSVEIHPVGGIKVKKKESEAITKIKNLPKISIDETIEKYDDKKINSGIGIIYLATDSSKKSYDNTGEINKPCSKNRTPNKSLDSKKIEKEENTKKKTSITPTALRQNIYEIDYTALNEEVIFDKNGIKEKYLTQRTLQTVMNYLDITKLNNKDEEKKCLKCNTLYDKKKIKIVSECGHNLCQQCTYTLELQSCHKFEETKSSFRCHRIEQNVCHKICPFCISRFISFRLSEKYVVFSLGEKTEYYKFQNGGYLFVNFIFFPENTTETYEHVTFEKNNKITKKFREIISKDIPLIIQNSELVKKWLKEVQIDVLNGYQNKLILI